ncbi:Uma2 family endonuclease [Leptolyngbya sp. KIOST-1]|uniref:Uma2 family endonuclease n=1 Tax=Leptolyngbya sp. KIOST-1 TaxID=1229172 RepID=UPI00055F808E|nr:Uma2 family endonuclease [Leptolyngbya sp. KIOST-1]
MIAIPAGFSPQEYLAMEQENVIRHEYRQGLVYAMAGGSDDHSRLSINLLTEINLHLRDGDCQFFSGDVKVNYADDFFYYPDAFVTCDPRDREDRYVKRYPKLVAEVLSPSTEEFDRGVKFEDYQSLDSLEEYVLISQDEMRVECRRRVTPNSGQWETEIYVEGEQVYLRSIGLKIEIRDLYRGVNLAL